MAIRGVDVDISEAYCCGCKKRQITSLLFVLQVVDIVPRRVVVDPHPLELLELNVKGANKRRQCRTPPGREMSVAT